MARDKSHKDLLMSMYSHSKSEIDAMFNSGMFNELAKAYMAKALSENGVSHNEIEKHLKSLEDAFSNYTATEIRDFYSHF